MLNVRFAILETATYNGRSRANVNADAMSDDNEAIFRCISELSVE